MTKNQLIEKLNAIPSNPEIFLDEQFTEFKYGLANSVSFKNIPFAEDPHGPPIANSECIVISEQ